MLIFNRCLGPDNLMAWKIRRELGTIRQERYTVTNGSKLYLVTYYTLDSADKEGMEQKREF